MALLQYETFMEKLIKFYINDEGYVASAIIGKEKIDEAFVLPTLILTGELRGHLDWYYNWYWYGIRVDCLEYYKFRLWDNGTIKQIHLGQIGV